MRVRQGFTLLEVMFSITILMIVMGAAVQFLRRQTNLVSTTSRQMDALQNAEFSGTEIERELREAGASVADVQPMMVQAQTDAITFNANMVSIDRGDVRAVYQNPDADPDAVRAMYAAERRPLPNTAAQQHLYPDTTYLATNGVQSGAETISYFLRPDSTLVGQANRYLLFRRVNATPATLIARDIVRDPRDTVPFFTFYVSSAPGTLTPIVANRLPIFHVRLHGSNADTAASALTDSIRVVRIHFTVATVERKAGADSIKLRQFETRVRMLNAGLLNFPSCGERPISVSAPSVVTTGTGNPLPRTVTVSWYRSADDGGGEKDIERYAIFRRDVSATQIGDPISSVPAQVGAYSYSFVDSNVQPGATYVYGVAAQDCTPSLSGVSLSTPITVNP